MPCCEYRYNKLKKQITIVPVAEEEVFATYFATATLVHRDLRQNTATHQPQVASVKNWLDQLSEVSTWTVIADPHRVLIPRLGDADVIDRRFENARQITTFGRDLSPFVRRLDQQLRKRNSCGTWSPWNPTASLAWWVVTRASTSRGRSAN
jgi:hypothetical protein